MIIINNLSLSFGSQELYKNLCLTINDDQRIGLVGRNGTGKSTLLKLIYDAQFQPNSAISIAKHRTIGYLPQEVVLESNKSVLDETFSTFDELIALEQEAKKLEEELKVRHNDALIEKFSLIHEKLVHFNPSRLEAETKEVLMGLGFKEEQFDKPVDTLSVGWKMRIVLAKLLLKKADFYLFDEPTNHLDIIAKDWFIQFLADSDFGFMMVSHERYFLNKLCTYIVELERGNGTLYNGNYNRYEELKAEATERLERAHAEQQREIKRKEETISRFKAKASKAKMAQSMAKQLDRIERIELPPTLKNVRFSFQPVQKSGRIALTVENLAKAFGPKTIFENVSFMVERGEKVAVVAANGVGKTTLFNCLVGNIKPDKGKIEFGHNISYSIFDQDQNKALDLNATILENIERNHAKAPESVIRAFLGNFLFSASDVHKKVKVLSGGEKNKVGMTNVLLSDANLLLLDEPTNHLDMPAKEALLQALKEYPGTVLFVSHDHDFINNLSTHILELTPQGVHKYEGNYQDFLVLKAHAQAKEALAAPTTSNAQGGQKDNSFEKAKQVKALERKIAKCEQDIEQTQCSFADFEYGTKEFKDAQTRLDRLETELKEAQGLWELLTK